MILTKRYSILVGYNTKNTKIESKIPGVTGLVATDALNTKAAKFESKVSEITNPATKATLNTKTTQIE